MHSGLAPSKADQIRRQRFPALNVAFGPDTYGGRRIRLAKSSIRIDLLGDQAMKRYREALGVENMETPPLFSPCVMENYRVSQSHSWL
jgi:hypothetical protein